MSKTLINKVIDYIEDNDFDNDEIKKFIDDVINKDNPTIRTISNRYSLIKKNIKENFDGFDEKFIQSIKPPEEITKKILADDMEMRSLKSNFMFNQKIVDDILSLQDSNDLYDIGIYLQFISGRRASEIYQHINEHDKIKVDRIKNKPTLIKFSTLHKKNNNKFEVIELIPNTLDSNQFKTLYNKLNKELNISTQDYINRINLKLKNMFPKISNMSSHKLRGMYARYMYETNNKEDQNINGYITKILNHGSPESSLSYSNYKFIPNKEENIDKRIKKKIL